MHTVGQTPDPIDQVLGEVPLPPYVTAEDVRLAVRAVVVHAAEQWPAGSVCRNDGAPYPCRLHRWGRRVLTAHGLSERQIEALERHGNPFVELPNRRSSGHAPGPAPVRKPARLPVRGPGAAPVGAPGAAPVRAATPVPDRTPGSLPARAPGSGRAAS